MKDETITNRTYKDGVFTTLFGDKEKICELYHALDDTATFTESDIQIQTLERALYKLFKDDLAFTIGNKFVILVEHQSTPSQNLPIRMLLYIARVYERLLDVKTVYQKSLVKIPFPEAYVLYNGVDDLPEELTLKLSDAFITNKEDIFLELKVKVININLEKHNCILEKSHTLKEYSILIEKIRTYLNQEYERDEAIEKAIKECIAEDILKDFLIKHGGEIYNMIYQEFNLNAALEVAYAEGEIKGKRKERIESIKNLLQTLEELHIPKDQHKKFLYAKYPEDGDLIEEILLQEDSLS